MEQYPAHTYKESVLGQGMGPWIWQACAAAKGSRAMLLAATVVIEGVQNMAVPPASSTSECQCHKFTYGPVGLHAKSGLAMISWLHAPPGPANAELLQRSWAVGLLREQG